MKIVEVKAHELCYPLREPFANSQVWSTERTASVVEIITDAGLSGWGEGLSALERGAVEAHLIGRDPFDVEVIWNDLYNHGRGDIAAISAVDIALWDIVGKALDMPVHRLLGGAFRERIPAYASGLFLKERADNTRVLADEARQYVDQGFTAVKMKIGFGRAYDVENTAEVRRAIGDGILFAVDANCGYDAATAIEVGRRIEENDIYWYEEPIAGDDVEGYLRIREGLEMRIAGGEQLQGRRAFRDLIQKRALDIVQPDISIAGGFTECRKVQAMASANGVRVLPHMWGTSIRLAATLHWQAAIPDERARGQLLLSGERGQIRRGAASPGFLRHGLAAHGRAPGHAGGGGTSPFGAGRDGPRRRTGDGHDAPFAARLGAHGARRG